LTEGAILFKNEKNPGAFLGLGRLSPNSDDDLDLGNSATSIGETGRKFWPGI
jgi:hypothetical protein